jgi:RHS repeat-associated protein
MGPAMWKHNLGIPLFNVPYGHISLYMQPDQQPFAYDRDYSRFEKGVTQEASQSGFRLELKRTISVGKNSGYCLEFTRLSSEPRSLVRCVVENSVVVLFYEGDPRYISDVFAALQGMSLAPREDVSTSPTKNMVLPGLTMHPDYTYDACCLHVFLHMISSSNSYKFTGKERDSESGLDNFGARYFGSSMGRFMSPDSLGGHLYGSSKQTHSIVMTRTGRRQLSRPRFTTATISAMFSF